jgi:hypothetical protein
LVQCLGQLCGHLDEDGLSWLCLLTWGILQIDSEGLAWVKSIISDGFLLSNQKLVFYQYFNDDLKMAIFLILPLLTGY